MQRRLVLGLTLLAIPLAAVLANDAKGVVIEKSFLHSVQDCVEYLQIPKHRLVQYLAYEFPADEDTRNLIHCVGMDLRWWNNTCGLQIPAIVNYFQPVQGDRQYEKRTNECLERNVRSADLPNSCCQAYETFQCYFKEFGNLVTCPQYVPPTKLQATQAALDCLNILRVPDELLRSYGAGDVQDVPETRCLYHCIDLRTGLYTPENGVHLARVYLRDLEVNDLRYLSKDTRACRDRIRLSGCGRCSEVFDTHHQCLSGLGVDSYTNDLIVEASKIALANLQAQCCPEVAEESEASTEDGYSYASYGSVPLSPCERCESLTSPTPAPLPAPLPVVTPEEYVVPEFDAFREPRWASGEEALPLVPRKFPAYIASPSCKAKADSHVVRSATKPKLSYCPLPAATVRDIFPPVFLDNCIPGQQLQR